MAESRNVEAKRI